MTQQNEAIRINEDVKSAIEALQKAKNFVDRSPTIANAFIDRAIITLRPLLDQTSDGVGDVEQWEEAKEIMKGAFVPDYDDAGIDNQPLWVTALDEMGIYPASVTADGVTTERSEWQDGWNKAVMKMTSRMCQLLKEKSALTQADQPADKCATCGSVGNPSCATIGCPDFPEPADKDDRREALAQCPLVTVDGEKRPISGVMLYEWFMAHKKTLFRALSGSDGRD